MPAGDLALADLRQHPILWLQANALVVYGLGTTGSGARQSRLYKTDSTTTGAKWQSAVGGDLRDVPYWVMGDTQNYPVGPGGAVLNTGSAPFDVHYVSMREFKNGAWEDANTTHYLLPANAGADMMVTSKLNGCTFGIGSDAQGARLVSHLRPPNIDPSSDAQEVVRGTESGFAGRGATIATRVNSTMQEQGTVIALRSVTGWTFYIQRFQAVSGQHYLINAAFKIP